MYHLSLDKEHPEAPPVWILLFLWLRIFRKKMVKYFFI
jgi:hypothetical protein